MALSDAQSGTTTSVHSGGRVSRARIGVIGSILIVAALGWLVLWRLVSEHAALEGGYGVLGPGMAFLDDLVRLLGGDGIPRNGLWGDICRALVTGGAAQSGAWPLEQFGIALAMWAVMALAMMLPTAMPMITAFGDIQGAARAKGLPVVPGWVFSAGYLIVWGALAVVAATLQWGTSLAMGEEPVLASTAPIVGGGLLVLAGLYQWSALKAACLSQCRSPMRFFMVHWRDGRMGGFRMGLRHGVFCVGCCWALMVLMFVGGTMNLVWMAVLTVVMLLEKVLPRGDVFGRVLGVIFVVWGAALAINEFI